MSIRAVCGVLILGGVVATAAPLTASAAQSSETGLSAPNDTAPSARKATAPNTNTTPTKHRYWRHRGGKHPHYGSRRVRT